jgi:hypothetical protein
VPKPSNDVLFRYTGPLAGFTILADEECGQEERHVMLHDGAEISLPAAHPHVQELVQLRRLATVPPVEVESIITAKARKGEA